MKYIISALAIKTADVAQQMLATIHEFATTGPAKRSLKHIVIVVREQFRLRDFQLALSQIQG